MAAEWFVWESGPGAPAENMAWDEALLESAAVRRAPLLRFYSWSEPAATFGYFQRITEVEAATTLRPLIRRPTGGGLVLHACDWTYAWIFPRGHTAAEQPAVENYQRLHRWLQGAFAEVGVACGLAASPYQPIPGRCFEGFERYDLLALEGNIKIAGAAQRRTRDGLLVQGSVQSGTASVERQAWQAALLRTVERSESICWRPWKPAEAMEQRVLELVRERYGRVSYLRRR
jgi:lipoate-protein ligase A